MSEQPMSGMEVTSDDKLWAGLGYPIVPVAIIMLFMEDKKSRPFIRFHAVQSIAANVVFFILAMVLSVVTLGFGGLCVPVLWLVFLYWGYKAYLGEMISIPVLTDFVKKQGWG